MLFPSLAVDNQIIYIAFTAFDVSYNMIDHSLKGCRCVFHTKSASGVQKAENSLARSVRGTCQYPFRRSNLLTNFAVPILSMQSSIRGIGYESVLVH